MDIAKALDVLRIVPTGRVSIVEVDGDPSLFHWLSSNAWALDWIAITCLAGASVAMVAYMLHLAHERYHHPWHR